MSANDITAKRQRSFFTVAALLSLIAPLGALAIVAMILSLSGHLSSVPQASRSFIGNVHGFAFLVDLGSIGLGIISLIGIERHGPAVILWKAVPGILASGILGFYHFMMMAMSTIIC